MSLFSLPEKIQGKEIGLIFNLPNFILPIFVFSCFVGNGSIGYSQNNGVTTTDPRQFVNIYIAHPSEKADTTSTGFELISEFKNDNIPGIRSYLEILDHKDILSISFDHKAMVADTNFFGSLSLVATIDGNEIEISLYSKVGEDRDPIGIDAHEPEAIATALIDMMALFSEAPSRIEDWKSELSISLDNINSREEEDKRRKKAQGDRDSYQKSIKKEIERYKEFLDYLIEYTYIKDVDTIEKKLSEIAYKASSPFLPRKSAKMHTFLRELGRELSDPRISMMYYNCDSITVKQLRVLFDTLIDEPDSNIQLGGAIENLNQEFEKSTGSQIFPPAKEKVKGKIEYRVNNRIALILDYFTYFTEVKYDTEKAFLDLIGMDTVRFRRYKEEFKESAEVLADSNNWKKSKTNIETLQLHLDRITEYFNDFNTSSATSPFGYFLREELFYNDTLREDRVAKEYERLWSYELADTFINIKQRIKSSTNTNDETNDETKLEQEAIKEFWASGRPYSDKVRRADSLLKQLNHGSANLLYNSADFDSLKKLLTRHAAYSIYRNLVPATIYLEKETSTDKEQVLEISLIWNREGKSTELALGRFQIKQAGWKTKIRAQLMYVDRLYSDRVRPSSNPVSNNFLSTPGMVFSRTFYNRKRTYNYKKQKPVQGIIQSMHRLEPSYGIHILQPNFIENNPLELGVGVSIGLFRNRLVFGAGMNLMTLQEQPLYFGVGLTSELLSSD